jgi:hypothetical protein
MIPQKVNNHTAKHLIDSEGDEILISKIKRNKDKNAFKTQGNQREYE